MNTLSLGRSVSLGLALLSLLTSSASATDDCTELKLTSFFRSGNPAFIYDEFASAVAANNSVVVVGARADGRNPAGALHVHYGLGKPSGDYQRIRLIGNPAPGFLGGVVALDGDSI